MDEGKPILKGKEVSPSPNSKYISHTSNSFKEIGLLAEAHDIDGFQKPHLTPVEKVVNLLATTVKDLQIGQAILNTGTSPLILSYECLKGVESSISPYYKLHIKDLSPSVAKAFGKVIKVFQNAFFAKSTADYHKVCLKVDIGTFAAALYHFVKHFSLYSEDNQPYDRQLAEALARPLLQAYSRIMKDYVESLPNATSALVDAAGTSTSIKEWYAFYKRRIQRDHKGGHCVAWWEGYPNEAARLLHVRDLFSKMVDVKMPELEDFPILKQCVIPNMDKYIANKNLKSEVLMSYLPMNQMGTLSHGAPKMNAGGSRSLKDGRNEGTLHI